MGIEDLRKKAFKKTSERVREELSKRDALIVQAVKTADLVDRTSNLLFEKMRDWHAYYAPELSGFPLSAEAYLKAAELGERANYSEQALAQAVGAERAQEVSRAVAKSTGADLSPADLKQLSAFTTEIRSLWNFRKNVEEYVQGLMKQECPNLSAVCGEMLGARLIATAGSLERLSQMPSSTIQVLGAEKALFAHLRKGTKPPKHGIIFQHSALRTKPSKQRGKIARRLAAKIAIASRVDYFKGEFCGDKLAADFEKKLK